ncbi:MAG: DegQ family serine endoprotease, partial [Candidatus Zixiibacteriota bacterium]
SRAEAFYGEQSPFVSVAEKVSPAVVNISAEKVVERRLDQFSPFDEFFRRFFGEVPEMEQPPSKMKTQSLGSGFVFKKEGFILTNNHVVTGADDIWVKLADGSEYKAELVGADKETDIAVLKIDPEQSLPIVELGDSDSIRVGDWAIAIGNPFPQLGLERTVTVGVISAKGRRGLDFGGDLTPYYQNFIQTDASINPGNSGGPLVNIEGKVIGINSAITNPTGMKFNIGIGFAIPINLAKSVLPYLTAGEGVARGFLGVIIRSIDKDLVEAFNLPSSEGVLVQQVQEGGPAAESGIKRGDLIIEFAGKKVQNADQFILMVAETPPDQKVKLKIIREGKKLDIKVALANRTDFVSTDRESEVEADEWLGLKITTVTKALADQYEVEYRDGVLVTGVEPGSPAYKKGIRTGDIILEIEQKEVKNIKDYNKIAKSLEGRKKAIPFLIFRNGNTIYVAIKP